MATVIGKKPLLRSNLKHFVALQGIANRTLFDRFQHAESNIIKKNIDAKFQNFLSYPDLEGDSIVFHGIKYTETPQIFSDLQGEDLSRYTNIKHETILHYNAAIEKLKNTGKTVEADFLADAIKYIDDRFIYCYDNSVVLGVWGMKLKDNLREDISEICKSEFPRILPPPIQEPPIQEPSIQESTNFSINFNAGDNGNLYGNTSITRQLNDFLSNSDIPQVEAHEGYEFVGWGENLNGFEVTGNKEFTAQYKPIETIPNIPPPPFPIPWYLRFWNWLKI